MTTDDKTDFDRLARDLVARHAARFEPAPIALPDPIAARRRWVGDRIEILRDGGFPGRALDALRVDKLLETPAIAAARQFLAGTKTVLVLLGGVGAGKTLASAWIALERGNRQPGFIRAGELERRGRYDTANGGELHGWLARRTLLVIDDLGVEYADGKGAFASLLDETIDRAYSDKRRIVLTSNLDAATLAGRVGERVWSRIESDGAFAACGVHDLRRGL